MMSQSIFFPGVKPQGDGDAGGGNGQGVYQNLFGHICGTGSIIGPQVIQNCSKHDPNLKCNTTVSPNRCFCKIGYVNHRAPEDRCMEYVSTPFTVNSFNTIMQFSKFQNHSNCRVLNEELLHKDFSSQSNCIFLISEETVTVV